MEAQVVEEKLLLVEVVPLILGILEQQMHQVIVE
tara:strand:- start:34 stop:135 length:102 start_codon:yes stop_codon:yes gene_type:complete